MNAPLPVAILGAGRIGGVHARTIATRVAGAHVVGVADPRLSAARQLAAELGVAYASADASELILDRAVEAVLVCSSTDTHADMVVAAARAGKHVFCEKPLDLSLARIDRVLAEVDKAGVQLMLGFNRRFDPDFARVQQLVAGGAVGQPELLRITSRDPEPPPAEYVAVSGGMFLDMTIHDFDMARFLMGEEVVELHAMAAVLVDPAIGDAGDVDTAIVTLRFESGALGVIENSRRAVYGYDQRVEVLGSAGRVGNRNHSADTVQLADARDYATSRFSIALPANAGAGAHVVQLVLTDPAGNSVTTTATITR